MNYAFGSISGVWRWRPRLSWKRMASLGQTSVQSKQRVQRELSTSRWSTFMHFDAQTSSHFMQLMHLSGSMAICINDWECRHPRAVPIGQTEVQNTLPHFQAQKSMAAIITTPAATPTPRDTPIACQVVSVSAGRTAEAALRIMFHGSTTYATPHILATRDPTYAIRINTHIFFGVS